MLGRSQAALLLIIRQILSHNLANFRVLKRSKSLHFCSKIGTNKRNDSQIAGEMEQSTKKQKRPLDRSKHIFSAFANSEQRPQQFLFLLSYLRDCAIITWSGGWEMGEICPKTKSYPRLIKEKFISTPPKYRKLHYCK